MSAEAVLGRLPEAAHRVEDFPRWLTEQVNRVVSVVDTLLDAVPPILDHLVGPIMDQARELLRRIADLASRFIAWINENVVPFLMGPFTLYRTGDAWTTSVFSQVTETVGRMDASETAVDDYWSGPAASAYGSVIGRQRAAANHLSDAISQVRAAIQSLAWTLAGFYIAIAALLALVAFKILAAIAATVTVVGIPPGLVEFVVALLSGVAGVSAIYATSREVLQSSADQLSGLLELQNDNRVWDNGAWPEPTGELGDATLWSPREW